MVGVAASNWVCGITARGRAARYQVPCRVVKSNKQDSPGSALVEREGRGQAQAHSARHAFPRRSRNDTNARAHQRCSPDSQFRKKERSLLEQRTGEGWRTQVCRIKMWQKLSFMSWTAALLYKATHLTVVCVFTIIVASLLQEDHCSIPRGKILYIVLWIHRGQGKAAVPVRVQPLGGEMMWVVRRQRAWVLLLFVKGRI